MMLVRFVRKSRGVYTENQLVKVYLLNIEKLYVDLMLPKMNINYDGNTTFLLAFIVVGQCEHMLCQHNIDDLVSQPVLDCY